MTPQEIIEQFARYVDQHEQGLRGTHFQDPYKSDFFALFAEAYNSDYMSFDQNPRLTADGLGEALPDHLTLKSPLIQEILGFWREWTYAWDRAGDRAG